MGSNDSKTEKGRILVADDEAGMRAALGEVLRRAGWKIDAVDEAEAALEKIRSGEKYDLLITDYRMGGMTGLELVRKVRESRCSIPIVMMTAYGTVEDAVNAMKEGADDYLLKPFSFETVLSVVGRVTTRPRVWPQHETAANAKAPVRGSGSKIIGSDPSWQRVLHIAGEVADSSATVLLTGESGTGKEVLAKYVHEQSGRKGPFVAINCAALPEGVLESELFGHEKGAFTGATLSRKGRFELADGGTILLDEVSEMPLALQAKLLRVLQEREISPIGGTSTIKLDIRVIATTNRNLEQFVEDGHFRRDLYYRLNVISIHIPALRHRGQDIQPLAQHFLGRYARPGSGLEGFAPDAIQFLHAHAWPGNVRELENLVERAGLLARGQLVGLDDFHLDDSALSISGDFSSGESDAMRRTAQITPVGSTLEEMEKRLILQTLSHNDGNRTRTAEMLGVSVRTIRNKLNLYDTAEEHALAG